MNEKRKINIDVFIGIILTAISVFFFMETRKLHPVAARFPTVVYTLFIGMSVLVFILGVWKTLKPERALKSDTLFNFKVIQKPLVVFAIVAGYMVLMNFTGFFISTIIFVPVLMFYYGVRSIRTIILTNIGLNLFVYLLFVRVLRVFLP